MARADEVFDRGATLTVEDDRQHYGSYNRIWCLRD